MSGEFVKKQSEKRKYIRHPAEIPIEYKISQDSVQVTEVTRDISYGGLCFRTTSYIEPGTILTLRFPTIQPDIVLTGTVVWCTREEGQVDVGVEFDSENEAYRARTVEEICYSKKYQNIIK